MSRVMVVIRITLGVQIYWKLEPNAEDRKAL